LLASRVIQPAVERSSDTFSASAQPSSRRIWFISGKGAGLERRRFSHSLTRSLFVCLSITYLHRSVAVRVAQGHNR